MGIVTPAGHEDNCRPPLVVFASSLLPARLPASSLFLVTRHPWHARGVVRRWVSRLLRFPTRRGQKRPTAINARLNILVDVASLLRYARANAIHLAF